MKRLVFYFFLIAYIGLHGQVLNEVCPSNVNSFENEEDDFLDWFEIYNNTGASINLSTYYLSDNRNNPTKWVSAALEIEAGEYAVINSDATYDNDIIAPFSLKRGGGSIYLANAAGILIDSLIYPELQPNHSYGRIDDRFYYFKTPSPEEINTTQTGYKGYASTPTVNRVSGNYPKGTSIVARSNNADETLYYSVNGTNPVAAYLYESPFTLNQTLSIRAVSIGDSMIQSPAIYRTYFVDVNHKLPVVNLNIDSLELLDEIIGIYMLGPDASPVYPYYGANFWKDIELHAYYEYFDTNLVLHESLDCGVKIHGGTVSSTRPMKSLRLVAHSRYEKEEFTYPYFENKSNHHFKRLLLRNSGSDYNKTHLKDGVLHKFVIDHGLNIDAQGYHPVIVYINGTYWGIHNMREKLDKYYPASNYGVDPETVNLLEEEELFVIAGSAAEFLTLHDFIINNDLNNLANYNWVGERLDLNSLVDYFIMELYVNNRDWPYNNLKLWNSPDHPQWRYFYSDLDAGVKYYGTEPSDYHSLAYILGSYGDANIHVVIFKKLLANDEFKRYFINRYADLMNTILASDYILQYIYKAREKINSEMLRHFYKWYDHQAEWGEYFLEFDHFFGDRVEIVQNELSLVFDKPSATPIYVGMYPADAGKIQLNTLTLDSFPFVGKYYTENPIDLTVKPSGDHQFLYWENLRNGEKSETSSIQINPQVGDSIIAVFKEKEDVYHLKISPNPVVDLASLSFSLPSSSAVDLILFTMSGQQMALAHFDYLALGSYHFQHDFSMLTPANYLLFIQTPTGKEGLKFVKS